MKQPSRPWYGLRIGAVRQGAGHGLNAVVCAVRPFVAINRRAVPVRRDIADMTMIQFRNGYGLLESGRK